MSKQILLAIIAAATAIISLNILNHVFPKKHEYVVSFNDRNNVWTYSLQENAVENDSILRNCSLDQRVNILSLKIDGKWVAFRGLCGSTLEHKEVNY